MKKKKDKTKWDYDCAIVGGGPGGLITALYLRRFNRKTLLVNTGTPRAAWGPRVNNLIGYDQGISGKTLLRHIEKQIRQIGGLKRIDEQALVTKIENGFLLSLSDSNSRFRVKKVILATGIEDTHPKLNNLIELRKLGLLKYCSICDGYEHADKKIAVLANDNEGIEKALFIANWTKKITLLLPLNCQIAAKHLRKIKKFKLKVLHYSTLRIDPASRGAKVLLNSVPPFHVKAIYVELGCRVRDEAFAHLRKIHRSKDGFLITTVEQRTSVPGLFAVGDCVNLLGQISVAAGQAAVAATTVHNDLLK